MRRSSIADLEYIQFRRVEDAILIRVAKLEDALQRLCTPSLHYLENEFRRCTEIV